MMMLAGVERVIRVNGTVIVELITFLAMLAVLARYVYPEIVRVAEARQRSITEQLTEAEKARAEAEARLKEAETRLNDARKTAQSMIEAATKSGEQLRQGPKQREEDGSKDQPKTDHRQTPAHQ